MCYITLYRVLCHSVHCTGGQSYCVGLWTGHRFKEPALQAAHAVWSLGATIGPFIIGQFLVELPPRNDVRDALNSTSTLSVLEFTDIMYTAPSVVTHNRSAGMLITYQYEWYTVSFQLWPKINKIVIFDYLLFVTVKGRKVKNSENS